MGKEKLNIFWFKRDLRIEDNEALQAALSSEVPLLIVYLYEPSIWSDDHYDARHKYFIQETLLDLKEQFCDFGIQVHCLETEAVDFIEKCIEKFNIKSVYSNRETGLDITYKRDLAFAKACKTHHIIWKEYQNNGIQRAIHNRSRWKEDWYAYMKQHLIAVTTKTLLPLNKVTAIKLEVFKAFDLQVPIHPFQKGGRNAYLEWKNSFFSERLAFYSANISKPEASRYGCSRLSPYISWGVCSIRELYQEAQELRKTSSWKRQLVAFNSRLRWQSHFIQKFESEPRMEFEAVNKGFLQLPQPTNLTFINAWKSGTTGYPLVDASLRCVAATGYINFRMRSLVTSFLTHHLFQHFTSGSAWLARQFLDFEPGIHYGQMQMQAGLTGTNTVRIYNPVKNALDHDPEAIFIKKWVPELRELPIQLAIEPWNITAMEEQMYDFKKGSTYPDRIVDIKETRAVALKLLYGYRKSAIAQSERMRILELHTIRKPSDRDDAVKV